MAWVQRCVCVCIYVCLFLIYCFLLFHCSCVVLEFYIISHMTKKTPVKEEYYKRIRKAWNLLHRCARQRCRQQECITTIARHFAPCLPHPFRSLSLSLNGCVFFSRASRPSSSAASRIPFCLYRSSIPRIIVVFAVDVRFFFFVGLISFSALPATPADTTHNIAPPLK
jgi:hypothetical protein